MLFSFSIRSLWVCLFSFKTHAIQEKIHRQTGLFQNKFHLKNGYHTHRFVHGMSVFSREISKTLYFQTTGHDIKWDHFDILASVKTDFHCKIKETLFIQELKPSLNVNISSEKLLLF